MPSLGQFNCPNDGTNDLDFVVAYDEDGPRAYICPVCMGHRMPLPTVDEALGEVAVILAGAVRQGGATA